MAFSTIPELLAEVRAGRMVVILDDEDRENEGDLIMAADCVRPEDINFMAREARGLICLALTRERCATLQLAPMVGDNRSSQRTAFTVSIEAASGVTTGISAHDRAHTIRTAVRADARPQDLHQPGHVFPLQAQAGGVLVRAGHTEAAVDLARMAGREAAGVLVEIMHDDGSMARRPQLEVFAARHGLLIGTIADLIRHRLATEHTVRRVHDQAVETAQGPFRLAAYRDDIDGALHFALVRGDPSGDEPVLVRVHVANVLSDALQLLRADIGVPVGAALAQVAAAGRGIVVVVNEPAGAEVLLARLREPAAPQPASMPEWRRNGVGAQILHELGARRLRVIGTPRRYTGLGGFGLEVVEYVDPHGHA